MEKTPKIYNKCRANLKITPQFILLLIIFSIIIIIQLSKNNVCDKIPLNQSINSTNIPDLEDQSSFKNEAPKDEHKCDLFTGEWVRNNLEGPHYTHNTCGVIQAHQNCMKYGRPDTEFLKWSWKPDGCDLPIFNPSQFLKVVTNKSLAFVGDSVARNHMQSLICLLSQVERPIDASNSTNENFKHYYFQPYNFTLSVYWSPFLVKTQENDPNGRPGYTFTGLFLDEADEAWTAHISKYDYIVISAGHWFFRTLVYREKGQFMGCRYCEIDGLKEYSISYGYGSAFKTAFRAILENRDFKGNVYLRTFAPSHFEGGLWDDGGDCLRTRPYKRNEINLDGDNMDMYSTQMSEFNEARELARKRGLKFEVMDMTRIMLMRPDGHPSKYGHPGHWNVTWASDCVHWCLPGPIDSWNDFLLQMMSDS